MNLYFKLTFSFLILVNNFVTTQAMEQKKAKKTKSPNNSDKDKLACILTAYVDEKPKKYSPPYYNNFNALHYATADWDVSFIRKIVPQIKKLGRVDLLNQEAIVGIGIKHICVPLDFIVNDTKENKNNASDEEKYDLVKLFLDAGAKSSLYAIEVAALFHLNKNLPKMIKTTEILVSNLTCDQIMPYLQHYYKIFKDKTLAKELKKKEELIFDWINEYHKCSKCNELTAKK